MLKSPLRYPGGKSKAIQKIINYLPENYSEYREPFVGGGSLFIYLKQKFPHLKVWINDLNQELFLFWKVAQSNVVDLVEAVQKIKFSRTDGRELFEELTQVKIEELSELQRAVRFFVLNRITFSGTVESGGFSQEAFHKRFTDSSIERLGKLAEVLQQVKITNLDYSEVLAAEGKDVLIFLDPPYFIATRSKLYGKDGNLHTSFEHQRFAALVQQCPHQWLITYDDSPIIRQNFTSVNVFEWEMQYGMNNYKQSGAAKGKELFITNYPLKQDLTTNQREEVSFNLFPAAQQLSLDL
ncbi:MAG TPA: modification methylase [Cyanobacteria bacterium UBA11049]|nr:modification methylase [Cyanobacteria bacterium UBA11049]